MTTNTKPRMLHLFCTDRMDVYGFLRRHPKSQRVKIEIADDNMDSVLTEVRNRMCGIGQISESLCSIILRNADSLYVKDFGNLVEAIAMNRLDVACFWFVFDDPHADVNFRVIIYAAR